MVRVNAMGGASTRARVYRLVVPLAIGMVGLAVRVAFLSGIQAYPKFELIRNSLDDQVFFHTWALGIHGPVADLEVADQPHRGRQQEDGGQHRAGGGAQAATLMRGPDAVKRC